MQISSVSVFVRLLVTQLRLSAAFCHAHGHLYKAGQKPCYAYTYMAENSGCCGYAVSNLTTQLPDAPV